MTVITCPFCNANVMYSQTVKLHYIDRNCPEPPTTILTPISSKIAVMCPCGATGVVEIAHGQKDGDKK